ncbi:Uncharacterized protein PHSC3_001381 [Chlamydiales bacterium STE3]|nr:Uncharacterized protein PHSC3_001381 [Chlamydiales bacterium STE3]
MNKLLKKVLIGLFLVLVANPVCASEYNFEVRSAAFFPTGKKFRRIYDHVERDYEVEASKKYCESIETWANVAYVGTRRKHGYDCKSHAQIWNMSFGINYTYSICCDLDFRLGIGPSIGAINLKNKSCCQRKKVARGVYGLAFKTGARYYFRERIYVDLFMDYLFQRAHFRNYVDVGGFKTGLGLGTSF